MLLQPYMKFFVLKNICWVIVGIYYNKNYRKFTSPVFQRTSHLPEIINHINHHQNYYSDTIKPLYCHFKIT